MYPGCSLRAGPHFLQHPEQTTSMFCFPSQPSAPSSCNPQRSVPSPHLTPQREPRVGMGGTDPRVQQSPVSLLPPLSHQMPMLCILTLGFSGGASGKEPTCRGRRCKRCRFSPWVEKIPCKGNGNPLQYSCLENPMDRGAWRVTVHGVAKSQTRLTKLSTHPYLLSLSLL